jgi:CBS domain-containing protein
MPGRVPGSAPAVDRHQYNWECPAVRVNDIMHRDVVTVRQDETCAAAAKLRRERHISSLVVSSPAGPAGIITERDYVNLVADAQLAIGC